VLLLARCAVNDIPLGVYETTGIAEAAAKQFTRPEMLFIARSILGVEQVDIMRVDVVTIVHGMPPRRPQAATRAVMGMRPAPARGASIASHPLSEIP
jgi:hypothetical protein